MWICLFGKEMPFGYNSCYSVGCEPGYNMGCEPCYRLNPLFWIFTFSIIGFFVSLFIFFWNYPGTLSQFGVRGNHDFIFTTNQDGSNLSLYDNHVLINTLSGLTSDQNKMLAQATCQGTSLLWTLLTFGILTVVTFMWWIITYPNQFISSSPLSIPQPQEPIVLINPSLATEEPELSEKLENTENLENSTTSTKKTTPTNTQAAIKTAAGNIATV